MFARGGILGNGVLKKRFLWKAKKKSTGGLKKRKNTSAGCVKVGRGRCTVRAC